MGDAFIVEYFHDGKLADWVLSSFLYACALFCLGEHLIMPM